MNTKSQTAHRGLLSIGAFSRVTRLSQKALRLYDQSGLLRPAHTDPDSGYRYYRMEQVQAAKLIALLRTVDLPLIQIRRLLRVTPSEAATMVQAYWQSVERDMVANRLVLWEAMTCLHQIETWEGLTMSRLEPLTVTSIDAPAQTVIGICKRLKVDALESHLVETLARLRAFVVSQQGAEAAGDAFGIFHGPVNTNDDGPLEICLPVQGPVSPTGDITARELPAGARAVVIGRNAYVDFPAVLKLYEAVHQWIEASEAKPDGPPWEFSPALGLNENAIRVELPYKPNQPTCSPKEVS